MKRLNARLIVSDFDGTLLNSRHKISDEVRDTINAYVADGGIFAVCTGRILSSILPQVRSLGLKGRVIACQGTQIADIESGEIIRCGGLDYLQSEEVCRAIEESGFYVNAFVGDIMLTSIPADNKYLKQYKDITGVASRSLDVPVSVYVQQNMLTCQKIASLCAAQDRERLYNILQKKLGGKYDVTCSADVLVEVSPINDNKGAGLKYLADYYGIPIEKTVAIGDNLNDVSMILAAGTGVAVGNAVEGLKAVADCVTVTNDEGAVAQAIKEFGYIND